MSTDLGIDLGSYRTVIYSGKSAVLDEHTAISYETHTGRLIAAGTDAFQMIDRTPRSITSVCPVKNGRIAEYDLAESMLAAFVKSVSRASMLKSRIIAAVPSDLEEMPKRAFYNICYAAGARDVCLIESPVAAAIGLETDFTTPKGTFIVDIGSGTTDIAALSLGGLVKSESVPIAGSAFRSAIENYVKREHNVLIGRHTADKIKRNIGCVIPRPLELTLTSKGQNQVTGMPQTFEINTAEMITAMYDTAVQVCQSITRVLESTPPDIAGDVSDYGITLIGGGSRLYGLPEFITNYTGLKVRTVENPKKCVARGTAMAFRRFSKLKDGGYKFKSLEEIVQG